MRDIKYKLPQMEDHGDDIIIPKNEKYILDANWVTVGVNPKNTDYDPKDLMFQYRSPVYNETMSTTFGSHFTLNPTYSFGPQADMHYPGRVSDNKVFLPDRADIDIGMGRYYCEAIQTPSKVRTLIIEAGVPEFSNMFRFLINSVDKVKVSIAREGRTPFFYNLGYGVGTALVFTLFPIFTIARYVTGYITNRIFGLFDSKYYSVKPTMPEFWVRANTIVNTFLADAGILTMDNALGKALEGGKYPEKEGFPVKLSEEDKHLLEELMPHIFKNNKFIKTHGLMDLAGVVSRYQKLVNDIAKSEQKALESGSLEKLVIQLERPEPSGVEEVFDAIKGTSEYSAKDENRLGDVPKAEGSSKDKTLDDLVKPGPPSDPRRDIVVKPEKSWWDSFAAYYNAGVQAGQSVLALQVEYVGSSTDSFSNSIKDIPLKSMMNSTSSRIRDIRFSVSDANWFGDTVLQLQKAVGDMIGGVIDGATLGLSNILHALNGNGMIDFPKMWDDSSAQLATHSFKMRLNTPYNNPISMMMDIYTPLACILALGLPKSIGRNAYTSPPLLKTFLRGVMNSDISMLTSLSITRGSGNLGHNLFGQPVDLEVTFTITDLLDVMASPTPDGLSGIFTMSLDEYSTFNRYSKLVTGQSYAYSAFGRKKALLRLTKQYASITQFLSPEYWGMKLSDSFIGKAHSMFINPHNTSVIDMFSD